MPDVTARPVRIQIVHTLGLAALTLHVASMGSVGSATARVSHYDGAHGTEMHQAASPGAAAPAADHPLGSCLAGSWVHAWEEDTPNLTVYRPADYPFDPSRGREGYEFQAGGILIYHGFGPADGPLTSIGSWVLVTGDQVHITVNDPQGAYIDKTLRIVSCDAEILQVERVIGPPP